MLSRMVPRKRKTSLLDRADVGPQRLELVVADVDPVDGDGPLGHVVEARQEVDDGRLAAAGGAEKCDHLARGGIDLDVAEHGAHVVVAEGDVAEADVALGAGEGGRPPSRSCTAERASSTSKTRVPAAIAREKDGDHEPEHPHRHLQELKGHEEEDELARGEAALGDEEGAHAHGCRHLDAGDPPCSMGAWRAISVAWVSWRFALLLGGAPELGRLHRPRG